jgi:hypothetical protein
MVILTCAKGLFSYCIRKILRPDNDLVSLRVDDGLYLKGGPGFIWPLHCTKHISGCFAYCVHFRSVLITHRDSLWYATVQCITTEIEIRIITTNCRFL